MKIKSILNSEDWEDKEKLLEARVAAVTASMYDGKKLEFIYSDPKDLFIWCIGEEEWDESLLCNLMYLETFSRWRAWIPGWTSMSVKEIIDELACNEGLDDAEFEKEYSEEIEELKENEKVIKESGLMSDSLMNLLFFVGSDEPYSTAYTFQFTDNRQRSAYFLIDTFYDELRGCEGPLEENHSGYGGDVIAGAKHR